jgi:hypothetical protein
VPKAPQLAPEFLDALHALSMEYSELRYPEMTVLSGNGASSIQSVHDLSIRLGRKRSHRARKLAGKLGAMAAGAFETAAARKAAADGAKISEGRPMARVRHTMEADENNAMEAAGRLRHCKKQAAEKHMKMGAESELRHKYVAAARHYEMAGDAYSLADSAMDAAQAYEKGASLLRGGDGHASQAIGLYAKAGDAYMAAGDPAKAMVLYSAAASINGKPMDDALAGKMEAVGKALMDGNDPVTAAAAYYSSAQLKESTSEKALLYEKAGDIFLLTDSPGKAAGAYSLACENGASAEKITATLEQSAKEHGAGNNHAKAAEEYFCAALLMFGIDKGKSVRFYELEGGAHMSAGDPHHAADAYGSAAQSAQKADPEWSARLYEKQGDAYIAANEPVQAAYSYSAAIQEYAAEKKDDEAAQLKERAFQKLVGAGEALIAESGQKENQRASEFFEAASQFMTSHSPDANDSAGGDIEL